MVMVVFLFIYILGAGFLLYHDVGAAIFLTISTFTFLFLRCGISIFQRNFLSKDLKINRSNFIFSVIGSLFISSVFVLKNEFTFLIAIGPFILAFYAFITLLEYIPAGLVKIYSYFKKR